MQRLLTGIFLFFVAGFARAQSRTPNTPNIYFTGGKVGIGTSTPQNTLHVVGQTQGDITNDVAFSSKSAISPFFPFFALFPLQFTTIEPGGQ
jgi:hypothetical protein